MVAMQEVGSFTKARVLSCRLSGDNHKSWRRREKHGLNALIMRLGHPRLQIPFVRRFPLRKRVFLTSYSQSGHLLAISRGPQRSGHPMPPAWMAPPLRPRAPWNACFQVVERLQAMPVRGVFVTRAAVGESPLPKSHQTGHKRLIIKHPTNKTACSGWHPHSRKTDCAMNIYTVFMGILKAAQARVSKNQVNTSLTYTIRRLTPRPPPPQTCFKSDTPAPACILEGQCLVRKRFVCSHTPLLLCPQP